MAGSDGFERGLEVGVGVDLIHFGELSHEPTRQRERTMRGFKSMGQAQRFLAFHGTMRNLFAIPRHLMRARHYRLLRTEAFDMYRQVTCA